MRVARLVQEGTVSRTAAEIVAAVLEARRDVPGWELSRAGLIERGRQFNHRSEPSQIGPLCASCHGYWPCDAMRAMMELDVLVDALVGGPNPWIPADPDGLPPETYPAWRRQEMARRAEK
jgi:hypothetical protein